MCKGSKCYILLFLLATATPLLAQEQPSKTPPKETPPEGEDPFKTDEDGPTAKPKAGNRIDDWKLEGRKVNAEKVEGRMGVERLDSTGETPYVLLPSRPFYTRYGQGRLLAPMDGDLAGFQFGDINIRPMGDVSGTYNDKVIGDKADFITKYAPGVGLTYQPNRQFSLDANYTFTWNDYADNQVNDFLEHDASVAFTIRDAGVKDLTFRIYDNYGQTGNVGQYNREVQHQLDNANFQSFNTLESWHAFERLQNNYSGAMATYKTGKIFMEASYEYGITDYFSRAMNDSDSTTHTARGSVAFDYYSQFRPFFSYEYDWIQPTHRDARGQEAHTFIIGTTIGITPSLNAYVNLTPRCINNLDTHLYNNDLTIDSGLTWKLNKRISLTFNGNGGVQDPENSNSSRLLGCGATMTAKIMKDLDLGAYVTFRNIAEQSGVTTQTNLYGVRVDYRIHRYLRMYALWNRNDDWMHDGGRSLHFDQNIGTIGFSARF